MDLQSQANEVKKALTETVLLSDGRFGFVITELDTSGVGKWNCHICNRVISTVRTMLMHLSHPIHMNRLRVSHHPPENFSRIVNSKDGGVRKNIFEINVEERDKSRNIGKYFKIQEIAWTSQVGPGEPIPPGMEDVVHRKCQIEDTLDSYQSGPLVGLEYIVELVTPDHAEPKYICLLCEKKGDPRSVMVHLTSHSHSLKYISCFFRTAGNVINLVPKNKENRRGLIMAVHKIAEEIEKHYGRLKPMQALAETFTQQKYEILAEIESKEHFRETPSTTFVQYCTPEKIREFAKLAEYEMLNLIKNRKPKYYEDGRKGNDIPSIRPEEKTNSASNHDKNVGKLSFSIGKPERSLGRNSKGNDPTNQSQEDDDVIFVPTPNEPIEVRSMSSISSESDESAFNRYRDRYRSPRRSRSSSISRSRSRARERDYSPHRRRDRSLYRRSPSPYSYRREPHRNSRSRSRSRSRQRHRDIAYLRSREDLIRKDRDRHLRDREKREKSRYDRMRMERDRLRRSYSLERERKKNSPPIKSRYEKISPSSTRNVKPELKKNRSGNDFMSKVDIYRNKLNELEVEMDNKLKYFRDRPEKHPQYSDEWKNFWNKRYKEIQQSGKDPNSYDFKPEWIIFWDERMKQLHEKELNGKKEELKSLIPEDQKDACKDLESVSSVSPDSQKDVDVLKNTWKVYTGTEIKVLSKKESPIKEHRSPSPSPWEESRGAITKMATKSKNAWDVSPPIIHCLRMLSVLEQQLGSLGPKALELLSKALSLEKIKNNESMTLLHDQELHIFFETVKEKIRGQLIAGIVARNLVNSCRSVINTIENMLSSYPPKPKAQVKPMPAVPSVVAPTIIQPEPVKVAGVGLVNKMAVAQQIAEILIAQGKTDVAEQELEELINAVVGIASSSNINVSQQATAFISQLNIQKSTANSHINELLSNIIASAQKNVIPPASKVENKAPENINSIFPQISSLLQLPAMSTTLENLQTSLNLDNATASNVSDSIPDTVTEIKETKDEVYDTDEDLKEKLIKFKSLSRDEQQNLVILLKQLERKNPQRVEKLRKYVDVGLEIQSSTFSKVDMLSESNKKIGRLSPFSSRAGGGTNPAPEDKIALKPYRIDSDHDDDDDDYSVEDVYKSVSEKLKKKEDDRKIGLNLSLDILDRRSKSPPVNLNLSTKSGQTLETSENDYKYSVVEPTNLQQESFIPSVDKSYPPVENQWGGVPVQVQAEWSADNKQWPADNKQWPDDNKQWPADNKQWPADNKQWPLSNGQAQYNNIPCTTGYPTNYERAQFPNPPGPPGGTYYCGEQGTNYMQVPQYNANPPVQESLYNNQGGSYNYQKPTNNDSYYNNYTPY